MNKKNIRLATISDAERILEIYNPYIENTCFTFEYHALSLDEFKVRMEDVMKRFPWIVCEVDGLIVGYAYTSPYQSRMAYSWDCSASIYVDEAFQDQGIGTLLYKTIILIMKELGYYNIYAVVTSPNPISLAFHQHLGFIVEGHHESVGFKFGKWLGVTRLVKKIGDFSKPPAPVKGIREIDIAPLLDVFTN